MQKYKEIEGDLIQLALEGKFDVITHGCNCQCRMGSGIAVPMKETFGCDKFKLEDSQYEGDFNKLGQIDYEIKMISAIDKKVMTVMDGSRRYEAGNGSIDDHVLFVVNSYSQYFYGQKFGAPLDYEALKLCLRKINHQFKGKRIGLPKIGCGLAGGLWNLESAPEESKMQLTFYHFDFVQDIIKTELKDMDVTIVIKS